MGNKERVLEVVNVQCHIFWPTKNAKVGGSWVEALKLAIMWWNCIVWFLWRGVIYVIIY